MYKLIENNQSLKDFLSEVTEVSAYLWERGFAEKNAGNISVNITELISSPIKDFSSYKIESLLSEHSVLAGMYFYVTATGKRMRDLARDIYKNSLIIKITDDGKSYYQISDSNFTDLRPTSELPTHLCLHQEMFKSASGNKVILHTHPTDIIALTQCRDLKDEASINKLLWEMHPETIIVVPEGVGYIPYMLPGSICIAQATIAKCLKHKMIIWDKHGVFSISKNVLDAFDTIDVVNKSASIYLKCKAAGFQPEGLTDQQLEELKELARKFS